MDYPFSLFTRRSLSRTQPNFATCWQCGVSFWTKSSATAEIARVGGHYTPFKVIRENLCWYQ